MSDHGTAALQPPLEPIAAGTMRDCFVHPDDPALCIKVPRCVQGLKVCRREARYIARVARRYPSADVSRVPRYLGRVLTDQGPGWVQQRVVNADGTPAPLLGDCLEAMRRHRPAWTAALAEFREWAMTQPLQLRDITPGNLCVRALDDGALQFVPVDGFSPRSLLQRLLPTRRHAAACNRQQLERFALTDVDGMIGAVERAGTAANERRDGQATGVPRAPRITRLVIRTARRAHSAGAFRIRSGAGG